MSTIVACAVVATLCEWQDEMTKVKIILNDYNIVTNSIGNDKE